MQMWIELTTMRAPDYFGEAAMLGRGVRHAAAIADSTVEVLVLLKLDFDLKIDAETRDVLNVLVSQYPKDANFVQCAAQTALAHEANLRSRVTCHHVLVLPNPIQWSHLHCRGKEDCMACIALAGSFCLLLVLIQCSCAGTCRVRCGGSTSRRVL